MNRMERYARHILVGALATSILLSPVNSFATEKNDSSAFASSMIDNSAASGKNKKDEKKSDQSNAAASGSSEKSIEPGMYNSNIDLASENVSAGSENSAEYATSTVEGVVDAVNGVVQVNCVYTDDSGSKNIIKGATGFLIGTQGDNSKQYLITSKQGVIPDKDTRKAALKSFGLSKADIKDKLDDVSYEVVVTKDMTVECSLYQQSDELDMAVFTLSENLAAKKPLSIYTSDDGYTNDLPYGTTDYVHSIGFPDAISYDANPQKYDRKDIVVSSGKIVNIRSLDDIFIITHDAEVGPNNCGGPLVNEKGNVIGMNVLKKDGQYSVAIDSTEIAEVLDSFGIEYNKLTPNTIKPEEKPTAEASVVYVPSTGNGTEEKNNSIPKSLMVILIGVIVLLIATMIAVVMLLLGKRPAITEEEKKERDKKRAEKKAEKEAKKAEKSRPERPFPKFVSKDINSNQSGGTGMETGTLKRSKEDGTSILSEGTALLSEGPVITKNQSGSVNGGTLIRKKTGDNILLCKPETTLGKDSLHVDYCIRDNSAISRVHAVFTVSSQGVSVEDKNSTNGTFVNGSRLGANEPKLLNKGDVVRLANEEFEYRK